MLEMKNEGKNMSVLPTCVTGNREEWRKSCALQIQVHVVYKEDMSALPTCVKGNREECTNSCGLLIQVHAGSTVEMLTQIN